MFNSQTFNYPPLRNVSLSSKCLGISVGLVATLCLFLGGSVGCGVPANNVIVDNTTEKPMVVEVNGQQAAGVSPGSFEWVSCMPGDYEFRVTSGNKEVYRSTHSLEPSDQYLRPRVYLLNPANNCGYTVATVEYGSRNLASVGIEKGLIALAEKTKGHQLSPNTKTFIALKRKTRPIPETPWFEAKGAYYLLQQPPKSVATRVGRAEYFPVLTRISKIDQAVINRAHEQKTPSLNDVMSLHLSTARAFQSLSELSPAPGATAIPTEEEASSYAADSI